MNSFSDYKESAQFFSFNEHNIAFWEAGEGPVLLLIHGFPSASYDWYKIWHKLTSTYRVIAFDMLGYGVSDKPYPHEYCLHEQADIAESLLTKLAVQEYKLVSHDYGDSVAQILITRAYQNKSLSKLERVCFLNGGLFSEMHRPLLAQTLLRSAVGPWLLPLFTQKSFAKSFHKIFAKSNPPSQSELAYLWELLMYKGGKRAIPSLLQYIGQRKVHRNEWVDAMQQSGIPLCFINGSLDPISGEHMLQRYQQLLPSQRSHKLPVGHYPQLEAPDLVLDKLLPFLAN